ncbi:hypothetical protein [Streptomyces sp. NPDC001828]|uniref:hypothetical protein n=1 Tax=Streptomyces sp. NPDC001828 TaxID=3364615 RepID=UPI0036AEA948
MDLTRRIAVTAVLAGAVVLPAAPAAPAQAAPAKHVGAAHTAPWHVGPGRTTEPEPEPASRAADRGDPMLDVVAVSAAALASAGGLLLARRKR